MRCVLCIVYCVYCVYCVILPFTLSFFLFRAGRSLVLDMHDGDQHDLPRSAKLFAEAWRLVGNINSSAASDAGLLHGLVSAMSERLSPAVLFLPVAMGGTKPDLTVRISQGDNVESVVLAFCEVYDLMHAAQNIYQAAVARLG